MTSHNFEIRGRINAETIDDALDILHLQLEDVASVFKITMFDGKTKVSDRK